MNGCRQLKSINFPKGVLSIGGYVFSFWCNLTNITYNGTKEQWNNVIKDNFWNSESKIKTITCTDGVITL